MQFLPIQPDTKPPIHSYQLPLPGERYESTTDLKSFDNQP